jgi:serine/threonine protein kinase
MPTQGRSSNFLEQTVACIRAYNANSHPDNEQMSKLARDAGLTVGELTCWFGLVPMIQKCAQAKASAPIEHVPLSPSETRSLTSPNAGAFTGQFDDLSSYNIARSRRSHSQMQTPGLSDPQSSQVFSPLASHNRRITSNNPSDTMSMSVTVTRKRPRLDLSEKLYPCLECGKSCPADRWYDHLVRVHFPECVWICGCKESKDMDIQKLWPRLDNFLKHLVDKHGHTRSPAADALMKSRGIEVIGCYHHICGFCETPLQSRQNSLDHIKDHLENGLQFENWTHLCSSNHDLRSQIRADLNGYADIDNGSKRGLGNDENGGDGNGTYDAHQQQNHGSYNTSHANARGARSLMGNFGGSQSHNNHQSDKSNPVDCEVSELLVSSDLDEIMLPFKSLRELGHGGYGVVDEVISGSSKYTYARKTIRSRQASHNTTSYISQLRNELRILKKLNHPHLIKLVGYYTTHTSFYIIMSPVADVNLSDYIRQNVSTSLSQRNFFLQWMSCLASAVEYLHDEKIQHRDIKPQNILVKGQDVYLTDLGNAKLLLDHDDVSAVKMIITPMYCAPETISDGLQDFKADIFSLGCVFTEMYSGYFGHSIQEFENTTLEFGTKPYRLTIRETQKYLKHIEELHKHALIPMLALLFSTIRRMLEVEPTERPEARSLQSSFPEDSRCCCSHNPSRPVGVTPSNDMTLLPASQSLDLEISSSSTSKPDVLEVSRKSSNLNDNSPKIVSLSQELRKSLTSVISPHEMGNPGTINISRQENNSTRVFTGQAQAQTAAPQRRLEEQSQPERLESAQLHDCKPSNPLTATAKGSCNLKNLVSTSNNFQPRPQLRTTTHSFSTLTKSQASYALGDRLGATKKFCSDQVIASDQSSFSSGFTYCQSSEASEFSGDIPQEDWNHAWALISKYPPQIVYWIIRELLSSSSQPLPVWTTFATGSLMASAFSSTPSSELIHAPSLEADFNPQVTSHPISNLVSPSSPSEPSLRFESADLNSRSHNDVVGTGAATRGYGEEQDTITTSNGVLTGQSAANIPRDRSIVAAIPTARDKEGPNQLEKRWFCVYDEHRGKSFGKPLDWKKHMNSFHQPGKKAWQCPEKDCFRVFDTPSNFGQHHRTMHNCRKPCKHADDAKMRIPIRRAFACGCQSCQGLLFSWDEWRNHVAQHIENGMTISEWQYNTLLRNLLRRPEIHSHWERHVAQQVFPYNVPARFNWRPRNTIQLKRQLEYSDGVELHRCAAYLVLQAYETGLEVLSAQELMDSPLLIAEPILTQKQPQYSHPTLLDDSNNQSKSSTLPHFHQESQGLHTLFWDPPSTLAPVTKSPESNLDNKQLADFHLIA